MRIIRDGLIVACRSGLSDSRTSDPKILMAAFREEDAGAEQQASWRGSEWRRTRWRGLP